MEGFTYAGLSINQADGSEIESMNSANKYLSHSFVESPDMKNVYDGMVTLDNKGEAEIDLPDWFGALNKDYRYQLYCYRCSWTKALHCEGNI